MAQNPAPNLDAITDAFAAFARAFGALLSSQTGAPIEAGPVSVVRGSLSTGLAEIGPDGCSVVLDLSPADAGYFVLSRSFARWLADLVLGARLTLAGEGGGALTEFDLLALDEILAGALASLQAAFSPISEARFGRVSTALCKDLKGGTEELIIASSCFASGNRQYVAGLVVPATILRQLAPAGPEAADTLDVRARMAAALGDASVEIQAVANASGLRFRDVLNLRPGLVLALPQKAGTPIWCQVNGLNYFRGEMVRSANGPAFLIQAIQPPAETAGSAQG